MTPILTTGRYVDESGTEGSVLTPVPVLALVPVPVPSVRI
jgi:hypothetical protein